MKLTKPFVIADLIGNPVTRQLSRMFRLPVKPAMTIG